MRRWGPALNPLLEIHRATGDELTEQAVKMVVADAAARVARTGLEVPGDTEIAFVKTWADRLAGHPDDPGLYQSVLARAIADVGLRDAAADRALFAVLTDKARPFEARSAAAMALSRRPGLAADVRSELPDALLDLGRAMAEGYNARPNAEFVEAFRRLEWAFLPVAPSELTRLKELSGTVIAAPQVPPFLKATYDRVHPLVKHVCGQDLRVPPSQWSKIPDPLLAEAGSGA